MEEVLQPSGQYDTVPLVLYIKSLVKMSLIK